MEFFISTSSGLPVYLQIVKQVKVCIAGGVLRAGDKLPSVRELAIQLAINPNTVSKAYTTLELEGLIEVKKGMGTFIVESPALSQKDKIEKIKPMVKELVVEAYHLQIADETLIEIVKDCLKGENQKR